jgi:hypothetical protein
MVGIRGKSFSVAELSRGRRAGSAWRRAVSRGEAGLLAAAREVKEQGTFGYLDRL